MTMPRSVLSITPGLPTMQALGKAGELHVGG